MTHALAMNSHPNTWAAAGLTALGQLGIIISQNQRLQPHPSATSFIQLLLQFVLYRMRIHSLDAISNQQIYHLFLSLRALNCQPCLTAHSQTCSTHLFLRSEISDNALWSGREQDDAEEIGAPVRAISFISHPRMKKQSNASGRDAGFLQGDRSSSIRQRLTWLLCDSGDGACGKTSLLNVFTRGYDNIWHNGIRLRTD